VSIWSRICLVQLVEEQVSAMVYGERYPRVTVIGVFRRRRGELESRRYRPYRYRSGLRYRRYLRILGRH
jgi:hypothetical protein